IGADPHNDGVRLVHANSSGADTSKGRGATENSETGTKLSPSTHVQLSPACCRPAVLLYPNRNQRVRCDGQEKLKQLQICVRTKLYEGYARMPSRSKSRLLQLTAFKIHPFHCRQRSPGNTFCPDRRATCCLRPHTSTAPAA